MLDLKRNLSLSVNRYDVIALVESGLDAFIGDVKVCLSRYKVYRVDRDIIRSNKQRGGGVLVYI